MNYLITYMFTGLEQEKKISASTSMKWNAKFLYCTALGFITKNEEYNPKENVSKGRYLKNLILQKVANNIN